MTCSAKAFPVFSPFWSSSRCLYSAYVLLIISLLALSTFPCVHLCLSLPLSMMLFNSSQFLCCSVAYFGVSTTSPKNSSSFNISPAIAITFIKCRNCLHTKNNIRYKDTNNTSVIKSKTPSNFTCLGKPPVRLLCCCCSFFIFIFLLLYLHLLMFFNLLLFFSLLFNVIPHPSVDYRQSFYKPFYTFSPDHRRVIQNTFIFDHSVIFLPRALQP